MLLFWLPLRPYTVSLICFQFDYPCVLYTVSLPASNLATLASLQPLLDMLSFRLPLRPFTPACTVTLQAGELNTYFDACAGRTHQVADAYVSRMLLELETAGELQLTRHSILF